MSTDLPALLEGIALTMTSPAGMREAEAATVDRLVSTLCRRMALRHPCDAGEAGRCSHRNHRRDVAYARFLLDMLGLSGELTREEDYQDYLPWPTLDMQEMQQWGAQWS